MYYFCNATKKNSRLTTNSPWEIGKYIVLVTTDNLLKTKTKIFLGNFLSSIVKSLKSLDVK